MYENNHLLVLGTCRDQFSERDDVVGLFLVVPGDEVRDAEVPVVQRDGSVALVKEEGAFLLDVEEFSHILVVGQCC